MAVKLTNENGQRMVGVAYAEPSLRKLGVSEFLENDQFSNIEVGCISLHQYDVIDIAVLYYIDDAGSVEPQRVFGGCQ